MEIENETYKIHIKNVNGVDCFDYFNAMNVEEAIESFKNNYRKDGWEPPEIIEIIEVKENMGAKVTKKRMYEALEEDIRQILSDINGEQGARAIPDDLLNALVNSIKHKVIDICEGAKQYTKDILLYPRMSEAYQDALHDLKNTLKQKNELEETLYNL